MKQLKLSALVIILICFSCERDKLDLNDNSSIAPKASISLPAYSGTFSDAIKNASDSEDETINRALLKLSLAMEDVLDDSGVRSWIKTEA